MSGTTTPNTGNQLKRNALGLPSAMAMSLAFISPTIGVIFISSLIASKAALAGPFVFILGTIGIALMALTLAEFAKRVTSVGGFYKFITLGLGSRAGFIAGMLLLFAYALQSPLNTNLFGAFVSDALLNDFGISIPWYVLMIGVVVFVGALAWYSVHTSMQFDIVFVAVEVAVVAILLLLIAFSGGDSGQIPEAFTPSASANGWAGIGQGFVFLVLAFFGFESCLTVAEETQNPRRNLPIALVGSVVLAGIWFTLAIYAVTVGYGRDNIGDMATATAPLHDLALRYIGNWYANIVDIAAISAIVAVLLAIHTANFRVIYSLGRDGLLPKALGRTHEKHQTPHIAIIVYSIATLVVGLIAGANWGPMAAFGNLGYLSSLGVLPIFVVTNIALPLFIKKQFPSEFSVLRHVIFPAIAAIIFVAAIWLNVNPLPAAPLSSFPWIIIAIIGAAAVWGASLEAKGSKAYTQLGAVLFMEAEATPQFKDVN